jgi:hypothetical protein
MRDRNGVKKWRTYMGDTGIIHLVAPDDACLTCGTARHPPRNAARARAEREYVRSLLFERDREFCQLLDMAVGELSVEHAS